MLVKVKFLRNGEPAGRPYTYLTSLALQVGDRVMAGRSEARVVESDVPAEEVAAFADRLKRIDIQLLDEEPDEGAGGLLVDAAEDSLEKGRAETPAPGEDFFA